MDTTNLGRLFVAISNIETIFVRYDQFPYNNILDPDELAEVQTADDFVNLIVQQSAVALQCWRVPGADQVLRTGTSVGRRLR